LAGVIQSCVRDCDFVARYGDEEFVVVMPQTSLAGACVLADRLRAKVVERLAATIGCGMTEYQANDDVKTLFARADSAFYSAKAAGNNRSFLHTGTHIREHHAGQTTGVAPRVEPPADDVDGPARAALAAPALEVVEPLTADEEDAARRSEVVAADGHSPQPQA
jgi:hypothetical protein